MNNTEPQPVLKYVVDLIKNTISDAKIEYLSDSTASLKDGNDSLHLEQKADPSGNSAYIYISDPRDIIYSEDLLNPLHSLHEGVKGELKTALEHATIVINDINVATHLVFQTVKEGFDQLSNSYEYVKTVEKGITTVKCIFKFGTHIFGLAILNETDQIIVTPEFASSFDPAVKKTITADTAKVQHALNKMYKEDKS